MSSSWLRQIQPRYPRDHWFSWLSSVLLGSDLAVEVIVYLYADGEEAIRNGMAPHPPRLAVSNPDRAANIAAMHGRMDMFLLYVPAPGADLRQFLESAIDGLATEIVWWFVDNHPEVMEEQETDFLLSARDGNLIALKRFLDKPINRDRMTWQNRSWWRFFLARILRNYDNLEDYLNLTFFRMSDCHKADMVRVACVLNRLDWLRTLQKRGVELGTDLVSQAFEMGHMELGRALMKHYIPTKCSRRDIQHPLLFHLWDLVIESRLSKIAPPSDLNNYMDVKNIFLAEHATHLSFYY